MEMIPDILPLCDESGWGVEPKMLTVGALQIRCLAWSLVSPQLLGLFLVQE